MYWETIFHKKSCLSNRLKIFSFIVYNKQHFCSKKCSQVHMLIRFSYSTLHWKPTLSLLYSKSFYNFMNLIIYYYYYFITTILLYQCMFLRCCFFHVTDKLFNILITLRCTLHLNNLYVCGYNLLEYIYILYKILFYLLKIF